MAEITFIGAAGTVTGSKHLMTAAGKKILIDCGLFQGTSDIVALNTVPLPVGPREIDAVIVTHGHIDHVGYLPRLVRDGFSGTIFATPPTQPLVEIVLTDAEHLQRRLRKRGFQEEAPYAPPPFYEKPDLQSTFSLIKTFDLNTPFEVAGLQTLYRNAAHIIGSAFVEIQADGKRILFSGDIGRYNRTLLYDPQPMDSPDALICESTYGDRVHPPDALEQLAQTLSAGVARGGAIVIPAFAVERTQEILFSIGELQRRDSKLAAVRVYLDSPMADKVDKLFNDFPKAHKPIDFAVDGRPFGCQNLTIAKSGAQSRAINDVKGPHIIISSSGMAHGGRVLYHLHNHVADPKATILFVGFQSAGTLGFLITSGAKTVKIFGDTLPVRAAAGIIAGYSAHADRNEIQQWLDTCKSKPAYYAVHGDPVAAQSLCDLVKMKYGWNAQVAARGTTVTV